MPAKKNGKNNRRRPRKSVPRSSVEVKRREDADIQIRNSTNANGTAMSANYPGYYAKATQLPTSTTLTMLPIRSFLRMSRGDRKNQMLGNTVNSKSIYMKGMIGTYKAGVSNELLKDTAWSNKIYLCTGWVKDTTSFTDFTTPTLAAATRDDVENFIANQIQQHFDQFSDQMRYREKKKDNIKIDKYQLLTSGDDTQAAQSDGLPFKAYWKTDRKVVYSECARLLGNNEIVQNSSASPGVTINMTDSFKESSDALGGDSGGFIPNNSWLPFACLIQPDVDPTSAIQPGVLYNTIHYFTDQ